MPTVGDSMRRVALVVLVATAVGACSDGGTSPRSSDPSAPSVSAGQVATVELVTGDCISGVVIGLNQRIELESTSVVDCDSRHDLEVFSTFELTPELLPPTTTEPPQDEGDPSTEPPIPYPGRGRVIAAAETVCNAALAETGVDTRLLGALAFWPSAASWAAGDRTVVCAIYLQNGRQFEGRQLRLEDADN